MTQTFTLNDLILGLYNELDQNSLEKNIKEDPQLLTELKILKESKTFLPKVLFKPQKATTEKILHASKFH